MQQDATAHFQNLGNKLQQLLKLQEQLLRENEKLRMETRLQKEKAAQSQEEIRHLREQVAILETATGNMDDASRKAFEKRINQYLREIDKVIAHLNNA
ncbi:MAG TPA: hypothetical protein VLC98_09880 [Phnomibacter sp.]|nr:hypothetical protein [Phnomibacter sp.]